MGTSAAATNTEENARPQAQKRLRQELLQSVLQPGPHPREQRKRFNREEKQGKPGYTLQE